MKYPRAMLDSVAGYTPGEQPRETGVIKLNTNENPYPPSPKVIEALSALGAEAVRKYPDPLSLAFRCACAKRYGYDSPDWVIAGNGMDELLALALRTFVDPGDTVLTCYPTYSLYEVLCALHGCSIQYVDLDDAYGLPETFFSTPGRLCFLARPNAPSGVCVPCGEVERLCGQFPGIVVIDEAYVDFADDNCMDFPKRFENAIVMRTFSKSFSLAGMRIGTAVARPELIEAFLKTKDSYNMNAASQAVGLAAIRDYPYMLKNAARIRAARTQLRQALIERGFQVPDSQSNFLLAHWTGEPDTRTIFETLSQRKILVRYFKARRLEDALRITVGSDSECTALLSALDEILG